MTNNNGLRQVNYFHTNYFGYLDKITNETIDKMPFYINIVAFLSICVVSLI